MPRELRMELLVHVSAPSSRKNDEKFKKQARAYASFRSASRLDVQGPSQDQPQSPNGSAIEHQSTSQQQEAELYWSPTVFLDDSQLAQTALESQYWTSSLKQGNETPQHVTCDSHRNANSRTKSPVSPSVIARKRLHSPSPGRSVKSRRLSQSELAFVPIREDSHYAIGFVGNSPEAVASMSSPDERTKSQTVVQQPDAWSSQGDDIPSQLPSTYSLSSETSIVTHLENHRSDEGNGYDGTTIGTAFVPSSRMTLPEHTPDRSDHCVVISSEPSAKAMVTPTTPNVCIAGRVSKTAMPPPPLPPHLDNVSAREPQAALFLPGDIIGTTETGSGDVLPPTTKTPSHSIMDTSPVLPASSTNIPSFVSQTTTPAKSEDLAALKGLPLSIHPPPPVTSARTFKSHLTTALRFFVGQRDLAERYKPTLVVREPEQSERGYWQVDSEPWSAEVQVKFWRFLEQYIASGRTGWGTWCLREPAATDEHDNGAHEVRPERLGRIKVFCFGEVAQHVYLLLYVASNSRMRKTTAAWHDADGEVVVQM